MTSFTHVVRDRDGLHARPAGMLVEFAKGCGSAISIQSNGKTADARRIFSIMGLCAKPDDKLEFRVEGSSEKDDAAKLKAFCESNI